MNARTAKYALWRLGVALTLASGPGCAQPLTPVRTVGDLAASPQRVVVLQSDDSQAVHATAASLLAELRTPVAVFALAGDVSQSRAVAGISALEPDALVALGGGAVSLAMRHFPTLPIVAGLVVRDESAYGAVEHISGVTIEVPTRFEFMMYRLVLPSLRNIGAFYSDKASGAYVKEVGAELETMGLVLNALPVQSTADVATQHPRLFEENDAVWLFADPRVFTWDNFKLLRDAAVAAKKPLLCSGLRETVDAGALMAVATDYGNVGAQLASMVRVALQKQTLQKNQRFQQAAGGQLIVNVQTAERIGVTIPSRAKPLIGAMVGRPGGD